MPGRRTMRRTGKAMHATKAQGGIRAKPEIIYLTRRRAGNLQQNMVR